MPTKNDVVIFEKGTPEAGSLAAENAVVVHLFSHTPSAMPAPIVAGRKPIA
jgi:hypothetical protein